MGSESALSLRGQNICANCGKFAAWDDLEYHQDMYTDMGGNVRDSDWLEHKHGKGCAAPRTTERTENDAR